MSPDRPMPPLSPDLRDRVLREVRATSAPTRGQLLWRHFLAGVLGCGFMLGIFSWASGFRQGPRPDSLVLWTSLGAALIAGLAGWLILRRGRSVLGRPASLRLAVVAAAPLALFLYKVAVSAQFTGMMDRWPDRPGLKCLGLGTSMALGPFVALVLILRRTEPNHPRVLGMSLGLVAAVVAWVLTDLWCPVAYIPHLLLGHVLPVAILVGLGAAIGRWQLGIRAGRGRG